MYTDKFKPRAIIFDLGSTLIEYEAIPWDELGLECAESGWRFLRKMHHDTPDFDVYHQAFIEIRDEYRRIANETLAEWDVPTVRAAIRAAALDVIPAGRQLLRLPTKSRRPLQYIYDDTLDTL
jgi:phosphoserine phosphatase